ncbi:hypothetical protein ACFCW2_09210 [Qipengyuania sp. DSG2-2]|uniref:hypothetical protein n=1 Tax=Qipengyuania sp. DGS2-2 TaxID=3349631 RepID=UPI0036D33905
MDLGVLIPLAPFIMVAFIVWTVSQRKLAEKQIQATAGESAEKAAQYVSHIKDLEDRVQVLERIVTDRGYDVATQIEALRDTRKVEEADSGVQLNISKGERV